MPSLPPAANLFLLFTRRLDHLNLPYMVSGSVAAIFYGEPRLTHDVDVILDLNRSGTMELPKMFPADQFYCPPPDVLLVETLRDQRGHFNLIHIESGFKADVYLRGNDPLHIWALPRARRFPIADTTIAIAPIEYVIVRKLEFFREGGSEKHLRDIQSMLQISRSQIDLPQLHKLLAEKNLKKEWQRVTA